MLKRKYYYVDTMIEWATSEMRRAEVSKDASFTDASEYTWEGYHQAADAFLTFLENLRDIHPERKTFDAEYLYNWLDNKEAHFICARSDFNRQTLEEQSIISGWLEFVRQPLYTIAMGLEFYKTWPC